MCVSFSLIFSHEMKVCEKKIRVSIYKEKYFFLLPPSIECILRSIHIFNFHFPGHLFKNGWWVLKENGLLVKPIIVISILGQFSTSV
jgi:hypothetical protein